MDFRLYLNPIRKWWWLILVTTALAAVSAYVYAQRQPPIYQAKVYLEVGNFIADLNPDGQAISMAQQLANTYASLAYVESVRTATMEALGMTALPQYQTQLVPRTARLNIIVSDTIPERAQIVANELANQIILQSPASSGDEQQRQTFIQQQLDQLEEGILTTQAELEKKQAELATALSARQISTLQAEIGSLSAKLATLQSNHAAYLGNTNRGAVNVVRLIDPADLPTEPINSSRAMRVILLAVALGMSLSVGAAFVLEYLDDTFKERKDLEEALRLRVLGAIPLSKTMSSMTKPNSLRSEPAAITESFREARINLQYLMAKTGSNTLLISSPTPVDGKTQTAVRLAVSLAQAGKQVALLDFDFYRPQLHQYFELPNDDGVTSVLDRGGANWADCLYATAFSGLAVMPAGPLPDNASMLIQSEQLRHLLEELSLTFDMVILDSPPINAVTDAVILSTLVSGTLMVISVGQTRKALARRALQRLRQVDAKVIGVLMNRVPLHTVDYHIYGYGPNKERKKLRHTTAETPPLAQEAVNVSVDVQPVSPGFLLNSRDPENNNHQ